MTFFSPVLLLRVLLLLTLSSLSLASYAQIPGFGGNDQAELEDVSQLSRSEANQYIAGLTDEEARALLLEQVETKPENVEMPMMGTSYISYAIMSLQDRSEQFEKELEKIMEASQYYGSSLRRVTSALFYTEGESALFKVIATLALLLTAGSAATAFAFRPLRQFRKNLGADGDYPVYMRLARVLAAIAHDLSKIAFFMLITVPVSFLVFDQELSLRAFASSILILVATIWAIRDVLKTLLFSPVSAEMFIRGEASRRVYYYSLMGFFSTSTFGMLSAAMLTIMQFPSELIRLNTLTVISLALTILIIGTFLVAHVKNNLDDGVSDVLRTAVSNSKHWLIALALLGFYIIGFKNIVIGANLALEETVSPGYIYYALLMFIFMPMFLRVVKLLIVVQPIKQPVLEENEYAGKPVDEASPEEAGATDPDQSNKVQAQDSVLHTNLKSSRWVRLIFILPYVTLIILFTLEGADIGLLSWFSDGAGSAFGQAATGVFVACMLGVIAWNMVNTYINKNLPKVALDPKALMNGEGGGADAATRTQTVLPIVRNFALVLIVIMVAFSVLSSLNINTAPLLAGAGVMGIAIGFGAQKLVQDVVSGMFFLFEDAFRIGEYIDTGSLVGTVESTSVRSLKLRHHLGAVQTVPYGEIRSVKNLSRDFVIMKLSFRLPFDTDIELVRRTIKKVGQAMLLDPELGPDFIAPLKSQGVQTAEDDALMIRMKFTAKPGKQWVIRREAYRLVKDALEKKGITFATRQVTVHVPENERLDPQAIKQAAGAAIAAEQVQQQKKPGPMDDM